MVLALRSDGREFVRSITCDACHGTGEVDDHYPEWRERGEVMRELRIEKGITLRTACIRLGVSARDISRMERGLADPTEGERLWLKL
jgi:hypothetical protein